MSSPHTIYGYFDSQTRQFVAFTKSRPPHTTNLLTRVVCDDPNIDIGSLKWIGNYDNGSLQVVNNKDKTIVSQAQLLQQQTETFFRQYPIHTVLVNLIQQFSLLLPLLSARNIDPETQKMVEMYQKVHAGYLNQLATYANSPEHTVVKE